MKFRLGFNQVFVLGLVIRIALLAYGNWQDTRMQVKYTDVDYYVFSDAADYVVKGHSPYQRSTYRYTPLLAWLLTPNSFLSLLFGKSLFVLSDQLVGLLIKGILSVRGLSDNQIAMFSSLWLLNPFVVTISTRGNAESLLSLMVLATLYLFLTKRIVLASLVFGLAVHFKIYPILYAFPLLFLLDSDFDPACYKPKTSWIRGFLNPWRLKFALISAATFFALTLVMYFIYGQEFLEETYLYHITRKDHRHNFSLYFYYLYLSFDQLASDLVGLLAFLPQLILQVVLGVFFHKDMVFCSFVQTFAFVAFQKVCTSQYFIWYITFLPVILPSTDIKFLWRGLAMLALWFLSQALWLNFAYQLEFLGQNTFIHIWGAGLVFFLVNCWILSEFIRHHRMKQTFKDGRPTKDPLVASKQQ